MDYCSFLLFQDSFQVTLYHREYQRQYRTVRIPKSIATNDQHRWRKGINRQFVATPGPCWLFPPLLHCRIEHMDNFCCESSLHSSGQTGWATAVCTWCVRTLALHPNAESVLCASSYTENYHVHCLVEMVGQIIGACWVFSFQKRKKITKQVSAGTKKPPIIRIEIWLGLSVQQVLIWDHFCWRIHQW